LVLWSASGESRPICGRRRSDSMLVTAGICSPSPNPPPTASTRPASAPTSRCVSTRTGCQPRSVPGRPALWLAGQLQSAPHSRGDPLGTCSATAQRIGVQAAASSDHASGAGCCSKVPRGETRLGVSLVGCSGDDQVERALARCWEHVVAVGARSTRATVDVGHVAQVCRLGVGMRGTHGRAQPGEGEDESGNDSVKHGGLLHGGFRSSLTVARSVPAIAVQMTVLLLLRFRTQDGSPL